MNNSYGEKKGRSLLEEMAKNHEEEVMGLYGWLEQSFRYLLEKQYLSDDDERRYDALVDASVFDERLKTRLKKR